MKKKSVKKKAAKKAVGLKKAVKRIISRVIASRTKKKPAARKTTAIRKKKPVEVRIKKKIQPLTEIHDLPFSYNQTRLVLLVRDPEWAYVYWDFSGSTWNWIQDFFKKDPGSRVKLRVYDLTENRHFDVDVELEAKSWYLCLAKDNHEFETELGLMDSNGRFHGFVRSNRMRTPRAKPSDKIDPDWDPRDFEELYRLSGGGLTSSGSSGLFSPAKKRPT